MKSSHRATKPLRSAQGPIVDVNFFIAGILPENGHLASMRDCVSRPAITNMFFLLVQNKQRKFNRHSPKENEHCVSSRWFLQERALSRRWNG